MIRLTYISRQVAGRHIQIIGYFTDILDSICFTDILSGICFTYIFGGICLTDTLGGLYFDYNYSSCFHEMICCSIIHE